MKGYTPYEPIQVDPFTQWAKQVHRAAIDKRRVLISAGIVRSQFSKGVAIRRGGK